MRLRLHMIREHVALVFWRVRLHSLVNLSIYMGAVKLLISNLLGDILHLFFLLKVAAVLLVRNSLSLLTNDAEITLRSPTLRN